VPIRDFAMPFCSTVHAFAVRVVVAAAVGLTASAAFAQTGPRLGVSAAADPVRGADIAQRWCATCHVTAVNQTQATGEAAPFTAIARRNSFDAGALALFLLDPHPRMPDMNLTRAEASDLAAYIKSLAPH
jgi:mono/diheme cytochrome c family protein